MTASSLRVLLSLMLSTMMLTACGIFSGDKADETLGWPVERLYSEAKDEMSAGNWSRAIKLLEKLEARFPFGSYAQQAQLDVAYAYYKDNDPGQAIAAADRFIKLHPNHPNLDYALYLKGLVGFNSRASFLPEITDQDPSERDPKAAREAFDNFKELIKRFPQSTYAQDAQARLKYLINSIALGELKVAYYYYERNAYLAAANRAQIVVKDFQETPAVEDALKIMARSYDALGLQDLRDDTLRVLKKNFPSTDLSNVIKVKTKPWWQL